MSIELVQAIYEQKELPKDIHFYHKAMNHIHYDGIQSQVYFLLKQQGMIDQTPSFFQEWLKEDYEKGLYQNLFIKNQTELILRVFEEKEIDVVPLKGVYFAEKVFGHVGARVTSDIDLLIRHNHLEKAIQLIKTLGFTVEEEQIPGHFHASFSKPIPNSPYPLIVEIHWNIVKESTSGFDINDFWVNARPVAGKSHIMELSANDLFTMICLHGWRHNLDSLKYFIDILQVLHKYGNKIDYQEIFTQAAYHQTLKRMTRTLSIVYQEFPHLRNLKELPFKKKKKFWGSRSEKGLGKYIDFIDYQFLSFDKPGHSLLEFGNWVWPSKSEVSSEVKSNSNLYWKLYKKRLSSMVKAIFGH